MRISDWSADVCSSDLVSPGALYFLGAALTGLGAYLFARDWIWAGALLLLLATPLDGIADRLAALRLQARPGRGWWRFLLPALSGARSAVRRVGKECVSTCPYRLSPTPYKTKQQ